jgi:hypothetical protein
MAGDRTPAPSAYWVVQMTLPYTSMEEVQRDSAERLGAHIARAQELHDRGDLLMAGAFLEPAGEPMQTMAIAATRDAAEEFVAGDPFVQAGVVREHRIRPWANMFARSAPA